MKKRFKMKFVSLLLAACMMLTLLPTTAFAAVTDTNDWPIFTMSEYNNPETQEVLLQQMLQNNNDFSAPWGTIVKEIIKQQKGDGPKLNGKTFYFQELTNTSPIVMKNSLSGAYNEAAGKLTSLINSLGDISKGDLSPTKDFLNSEGSKIANIETEGPAFARYQMKTLSGSAFGNEFIGYYGDAGAITIQLFYDFKVEGLNGKFKTPDFNLGDNMKDLSSKGIIYDLGGSSDSYTVKAENYNDFSNTVQKSYTYEKSTATSTEVSNSYTKDWSEETTISVGIKLPFVNLVSGQVEQKVGYSYGISKTYSTSKSDTYTQSISDTIEVPLPPHTGIDIDVNIIDTTTSIPYTGAVRITYKTKVIYAAGISEHEDGQGSKQNVNGYFSFGNETYTAIQDLDRRIINAGISGYDPDGLNLLSTSPGLMSNSGFASAANKLRSGQPYSPYGGVFNYTSKGTTITPRKVVPIYPADRFVPDIEEITLYEQQSRRLDSIKLDAFNEHDVPYYGFNARLDGTWTVVDNEGNISVDYAKITKDRNGYPLLKATAPNTDTELYLKYAPNTSKIAVSGDYNSEIIMLNIKPVALTNVTLDGSFADIILDDGTNTADAADLKLTAKDVDGQPFTPTGSAIKWFAEEGKGIEVNKDTGIIEFDQAGTYQIYAVVNEMESNRIPLTVLPARMLEEIFIEGEIPILIWDEEHKNVYDVNSIEVSGKDQYDDPYTVSGIWALGSDGIEDEDLKIAETQGNILTGLRAGSDMLWLQQNIGTTESPNYVNSNSIPFTVRDASYPLTLSISGTIPELYYNHDVNKSFALTNLSISSYDQYGELYALDSDLFEWTLNKPDHASVENNIITGIVVGTDDLTLSYPTKAKDDEGNPLINISAKPLSVIIKALPYVNELYQGETVPIICEAEEFELSNIILLARDQYGNTIAVPDDLQWTLAGNNGTKAVIEGGKLTVTEGQVKYASWADVILEAHSPQANRTAKNVAVRVRQQPILNKLTAYVSDDFVPKWQENAILNEFFTADGFDQYGNSMPVNPVWNSSDVGAVSLENGILTFLLEDGISIITAKSGDVVSNGITITVPGTPRVTGITVGGAPSSVNLNAKLELSALSTKVFDQYGKQFDTKSLSAYPAAIRWTLEKGTTEADISGNTVRFGNKAGTMTLICTVVNSHTNEGLVQKQINIQVDASQITPPSGGGGVGVGGGIPMTPTYNAILTGGVVGTLPVKFDADKSSAAVEIGDLAKDIFASSKNTIITMPSIEGVKSFTLKISADYLKDYHSGAAITFDTGENSILLSSNMLMDLLKTADREIGITVEKEVGLGIPGALNQDIGNKPAIRLVLTIDGRQGTWDNLDFPMMVSIPYKPIKSELDAPESIIIWHLEDSGNTVCIPNGIYDPETGAVTFSAYHLGSYAIGYNKVSFIDVPDTAWYREAVYFLAARGITAGTAENTFSPDQTLTRGQFITLLLRAYGIKGDEKSQDNFSDAGNTYYTGYLAAAKRLGISNGVGEHKFAPEQPITRQEMVTLLFNALSVLNKLPDSTSDKTLNDFIDANIIASYAKNAMSYLVETGVIGGSNGKLEPTNAANRAEIVQIIYNLMIK